jgi:hypothetical protein
MIERIMDTANEINNEFHQSILFKEMNEIGLDYSHSHYTSLYCSSHIEMAFRPMSTFPDKPIQGHCPTLTHNNDKFADCLPDLCNMQLDNKA